MDDKVLILNETDSESQALLSGRIDDIIPVVTSRSRASTRADNVASSRASEPSRNLPKLLRTVTSSSNEFSAKTWFAKAVEGDVDYFQKLSGSVKDNRQLLKEIQESRMENKSLLHIAVQLKHVKLSELLVESLKFGAYLNHSSTDLVINRTEGWLGHQV